MEKQLIISIGREFGSGGHVIAEALAKRFNIPMYDHNLLDHIAEEKNLDLAREVIAKDDVVDDYFSKAKSDIISYVAKNPEEGEFALDILMIAKYLERIGDHAVNIAEWVIYCITGVHKEV